MNSFLAVNGVTRRALHIPYESPFVCQLVETPYGSGSSSVSTLDILPTFQEAGPVLAISKPDALSALLDWSAVPNGYAYVIYRATDAAGPFSVVASGVIARFFLDAPGSGTFFYKVTGLEPNFGETAASNTVSITLP